MQNLLCNEKDKLNYLKGLIRLTISNGDIAEEQKQFFVNAANGMELDDKDKAELNKCWSATEVISLEFSSKEVSLFFIQEAIQICVVDGVYDEIERNEIYQTGAELGINADSVNQLEKWVEEGIAWRKRGEQLLKELSESEAY